MIKIFTYLIIAIYIFLKTILKIPKYIHFQLTKNLSFSKNLAETFHFIAITIGLLYSSWWAVNTFDVLHKKEVAETNLEKAVDNLKKTKLELKELREKINGTISSDITINIEQYILNQNKVGLIINVNIKNNGTQNIDMSWKKTPLKIYKLAYKNDLIASENINMPYLYRSLKMKKNEKNISINNLYLFVGAQKNLSFFLEVERNNLYYITFESKVDISTKKSLTKKGKTGIWLSSKYVFIK